MLGGDVLVAHRARLVIGAPDDFGHRAAELGRRRGVAGDDREPVELLVGASANPLGIDAQALEHGHDDAALLLEQREQQVHRSDLGITTPSGQPLGGLDGLLRFDCESISLHIS